MERKAPLARDPDAPLSDRAKRRQAQLAGQSRWQSKAKLTPELEQQAIDLEGDYKEIARKLNLPRAIVRRIRLAAGLLAVRFRDENQKPWAKKGPGEVYRSHNIPKPRRNGTENSALAPARDDLPPVEVWVGRRKKSGAMAAGDA
jgi:hypothetical protein